MDSEAILPNYTYVFSFEKDFEYTSFITFFNQYWTASYYFAAVYIAVILVGRKWMTERSRYELRGPLILWNSILAAFSIVGAFRTVPELFHVITQFGFFHSICAPNYIENDKVQGFWTTVFMLSKVPELGDTVFIVLRKQPLIFLHFYHHATVLIYSWYAFTEYTAPARWFVTMNFMVHAAMYSYYALKAMRIRVPRVISMVITLAQLTQMVTGCTVNIRAYQMKQNGELCKINENNVKLSLLMYLSYFVLFARFFYKAYLTKREARKIVSTNVSDIKKLQ